jgi:beta-lactamase regulating signal transducer with metallopeptidase domain
MNDLGIALVWLTVQVTAVALAGLGLSVLAARRAPGGGAGVALIALAATVVLAGAACCPLPSWWAWETLTPSAVAVPTADPPAGPDAGPSSEEQEGGPAPTGGTPLAVLTSALRSLARRPAVASTAGSPSRRWPAIVAVIALAGTAFGLLRLLLGLGAIRRSLRRSRPVADPDMLRLVEELRPALGVKRPVAVRESADLTTPATAGWREPVLLLPADWRGWTAAERRAVVAHELAHVGRGDFAAWLLARLSVAVHFWHPLVRLLAGRLQLQQELAADAAAARLVGGRPAYLRALASLALRFDDRGHCWPAPALLSRQGTLLRRVEMLRVTDDGRSCPASRSGRMLTYALLVALTLTASALRGPVQEARSEPPPQRAKPAEEVAPFDLTLLGGTDDKDLAGFIAVRPAAILKRPETKAVARLLNDQIDAVTAAFKADGVVLHIEDVEQAMGRLYLKGENQPGKRSLVMSMNVLRTTRDVDWEKLRDRFGPAMKRHEYRGETYVSFQTPPEIVGLLGVNRGVLWAADRRTLLYDSEAAIKARIDAKLASKRPALPAYAAGWEAVSRGLFAVALDNHGGRLFQRSATEAELKAFLADPTKPECHLTRFFRNASHVVAGVAGDDDFRLDLRASAETPEAAAEVARSCEGFLTVAKKAIPEPTTGALAAASGFMRKITDSAKVRRDGAVVTVHAEVAEGFNGILAPLLSELAGGDR